MPTSTVVKHFADGSIVLKDATGTPIDITIPFSTGDLSISGLNEGQREVVAYEARGVLTALRKGNRLYPSGSFSCQMASFTSASDNSPADAVRKLGAFAAGVSTNGANADVWTLDLVLTVEGTDFGDGADHTITLTKCACTIDFSEGGPNSFTVNFTCYGTVTGV